MDLTSSFFETADGEGYWYSNQYDSHHLEFRKKQLDTRANEVREFIDELHDQDKLE